MLLTDKTAENRQIWEAICFLLYDRKILKENKKESNEKLKKNINSVKRVEER